MLPFYAFSLIDSCFYRTIGSHTLLRSSGSIAIPSQSPDSYATLGSDTQVHASLPEWHLYRNLVHSLISDWWWRYAVQQALWVSLQILYYSLTSFAGLSAILRLPLASWGLRVVGLKVLRQWASHISEKR